MTEDHPRQGAGFGEPQPGLESSGSRTQETFPVVFRGETGTCFRIWIVNKLLSLATLGIYSAWAKVRMKRFMQGHTEFAGFGFDYHANPMSILLSRIILALGLLLINYFVETSDEVLGNYYPLVLALLIPPLVARGLSFNARYTSYRTLRFRFDRRLREVYFCFIPYFGLLLLSLWFSIAEDFDSGTFFGFASFSPIEHAGVHALSDEQDEDSSPKMAWALITLISIALLALSVPYFIRAFHRYRVGNHSLGGVKLSHHAGVLPYYGAFLPVAAGIMVAAYLLVAEGVPGEPDILWIALIVVLLLMFTTFVVRTHLTRLLLDNIRFEGGKVSCRLKILPYAWMLAYTFLLTVASFWLLRPWSIVLRARRLANATSIVTDPETLESIVGHKLRQQPAIGDAALDSFDFDVGLV